MLIVTGGAGFIGSNLVKELNRSGRDDILIVDDLSDGRNYKNLRGLKFLDYQHKDDFLQSIEADSFDGTDIDAIFHEGGVSDTMEYDVNYLMKENYEYSKVLLHFAMEHRIPFLYASSAAVYGRGEGNFIEDEGMEDALTPYAFSKLVFDRYVLKVALEARSQVVGLRYFNVYGPQEKHKGKRSSVIYQFIRQIEKTGEATLFGEYDLYEAGEQRRDFIHVADVVKVNLWFWQEKGASGIYNCGTGKAYSFNEVASLIIRQLGRGKIVYRDFPEILKGKYQQFTRADTRKLLKAGYDGGFTDLSMGIFRYTKNLEAGGYFRYEV